jgi:protein-S-isoprenylcysteine O-methyltransferase Ste14
MHGETETARGPRWVWVTLHLLELAVALWIVLGGGYALLGRWVGRPVVVGDGARRWVLAAFAVILFARMSVTGLVLLKRKFAWNEALAVAGGSGVYQLGFALCGAGTMAHLSVLDGVGVVLFVLGSVLNTGSELQRRAFKARPEHRGQLFTGGFFSLCRHPNYLGDAVWGVGWALLTQNPWSTILVAIEVGGFVFSQIPLLDRYLDAHYGEAYRDWARRTKRFIPFVY